MSMSKPTKPTNEFLPNGFGTASGVVKNDFSSTKKENGFSTSVEDILQGDNLNYMLDTIGKQLKYLTTVVDYLVDDVNIGQIPYVSTNGFDVATIHTLLPSQTGNSGKLLTTNGANTLSWTNAITQIGDPIFTLNFNLDLTNTDYVWLEGGVVSKTDFPELFAIYGYNYDTSYNQDLFKLPDFRNRAVYGGTTTGYIEASIPNIKGFVYGSSQISPNDFNNEWDALTEGVPQNAFTVRGGGVKVKNDGEKDNTYNFDASRCSNVYKNGATTVQPPAIKVRVYTRAR